MSIRHCVLTLAVALAVVGCNKKEEVVATDNVVVATSTAPAVTETNEPVVAVDSTALSPTAKVWVESVKIPVAMTIQAERPLTPEQIACLKSPEADVTYTQKAQEEINRILTPELLKESDEFYASPTGQKLALFGQQQAQIAMGETVANPVELTAEDQAAIVGLQNKEFAQKMQADGDATSQEDMMKTIEMFVAQEMARCNIQ